MPPISKPNDCAGKSNPAEAASRRIDERIRSLSDWRGETLARMRALILAADPAMTEDCKWIKPTNPLGVPVWSHAGIVCTGEAYAKVVKLTFAKGAAPPDPARLFNASLEGGTRRAIDIREGETVDARAFKALVQAAVAHNAKTAKPATPRAREPKPAARAAKVQKAVKWNSPFYGIEGQGWFLSFHVFTRYIKVAFFRGTSLRPLPPVASKDLEARYFHIHEGDALDEAQLAKWVKQAAALPGFLGPRS